MSIVDPVSDGNLGNMKNKNPDRQDRQTRHLPDVEACTTQKKVANLERFRNRPISHIPM